MFAIRPQALDLWPLITTQVQLEISLSLWLRLISTTFYCSSTLAIFTYFQWHVAKLVQEFNAWSSHSKGCTSHKVFFTKFVNLLHNLFIRSKHRVHYVGDLITTAARSKTQTANTTCPILWAIVNSKSASRLILKGTEHFKTIPHAQFLCLSVKTAYVPSTAWNWQRFPNISHMLVHKLYALYVQHTMTFTNFSLFVARIIRVCSV